MKILNEKGFSLIQVMVAFGLAGVLSLVVMKTTENARKAQKYTEVKSNEMQIINQINNYISNSSVCTAAFSGFRAGDHFGNLIFNTKGTGSKLVKGEEVGNTKLIIEDLQVLPQPVFMGGADNLFEMTFRIRTKRKDGKYNMAGTSKNKDFKFLAQLCEPWMGTYTNAIEYTVLKNKCDQERITDLNAIVSQTPLDGEQAPVGLFTCRVCGKDKMISSCAGQ